jgi:uncharacterized repeat protein (TIGR01451 family)
MLLARRFASVVLFVAVVHLPSAYAQTPIGVTPQRAYGSFPMEFEGNAGQTDARVRFMARGAGYTLFITESDAVAVLQSHRRTAGGVTPGRNQRPSEAKSDFEPPVVVRMQLLGANRHPSVRGEDPLPGASNYFIGNDPSKWRTNVAHYAKVRLSEVYPGIDVVYYGNHRQIEYDFIVSPGADPRQIRLHYEGTGRIDIDPAGDLVLHVKGGELRIRRPVVYQESVGSRDQVSVSYRRLASRDFGFQLGGYDAARPLVIDPVLSYSTYLGGSAYDSGHAVAVDSSGSAYITGVTTSADFPTASPLQPGQKSEYDVFVAKVNPSGSGLIYSTFLGGSRFYPAGAVTIEAGIGIAVDTQGNAYITGHTDSNDFPTANPLQAASGGSGDAFVTKLNASGSALVYSTYLGSSGDDRGHSIAVDRSGNAYVAGSTGSSNFPTANPLQATNAGISDAFVTKLNPDGSALVYSTYVGGSGADWARSIALDSSGNAYFTGHTRSSNFPTVNPIQEKGFGEDAFVAKLNSAGSALSYSTYLSGSALTGALWANEGFGIAVDTTGNAYVTGTTYSDDFPTVNAVQASFGGRIDAFVTKLNATGSALIYSTYLGGSQSDEGSGIAVDSTGNVYVTGATWSTNFPTANPLPSSGPGMEDAFAAKLNASGGIVWSTYLGGSDIDLGNAIAVDGSGDIYIVGSTRSSDFPTRSPIQDHLASQTQTYDVFLTKLTTALTVLPSDMTISKTHDGNFRQGQSGATFAITASNAGLGPSSGTVTVIDTLPAGMTATAIGGSGWTCVLATLTCARNDLLGIGASYPPIMLTVNVSAGTVGSLTNTAAISGGGETNTANNTATDVTMVATGGEGAIPAIAPIPALESGALVVLALLLATLGILVLRRP